MKIDKNTIRITHRNAEIKRIMSEGGAVGSNIQTNSWIGRK